jgi:hypothetical protein
VDFGGGALTSASQDGFVASFASAGAHRWSKRFGDIGQDAGAGVALDGSGNVTVTGSVDGSSVDLGGGPLTGGGGFDLIIASYDPAGAHRWSRRFGGLGWDRPTGIAADASGNVVITGSFGGSVNFGGGTLMAASSEDIVVASYGPTGAHRWSRSFGHAVYETKSTGVALTANGTVYVGGYFEGVVDFGKGPLTAAGYDVLLLQLAP